MDKNVGNFLTFLSMRLPARNTLGKAAGQGHATFPGSRPRASGEWKSRKIGTFLSTTLRTATPCVPGAPSSAHAAPARGLRQHAGCACTRVAGRPRVAPARHTSTRIVGRPQVARRCKRAADARNLHQSKICGGFVSRPQEDEEWAAGRRTESSVDLDRRFSAGRSPGLEPAAKPPKRPPVRRLREAGNAPRARALRCTGVSHSDIRPLGSAGA